MITYATTDLIDHLCDAVDNARAATNDSRWLNAIDRAWEALLTSETIRWDAATHALFIQSATHPAKLYRANGTCECAAFIAGRPCYHRAAARLVRRALELRDATPPMPAALPRSVDTSDAEEALLQCF